VTVVRPKKSLGQHFLTDQNIARKIVDSLTFKDYDKVLEIGPGMGVLSGYLLELPGKEIRFAEIDRVAIQYLKDHLPQTNGLIFEGDVMQLDWAMVFTGRFAVIGNFPYNISSQLFFRALDFRNQVTEVVCMLQKEVAKRLASPPGSREYGILSVLLQAYYQITYLFDVPPQVFHPPPKVQSAVIRLERNDRLALPCDEKLFKTIVKTAFNQRRKVLRNSLQSLYPASAMTAEIFRKRPEQLGVEEFVQLTRLCTGHSIH
jgi:16S rRNA (adenine1518-N6/adenine1519-N6)-dimethyltransferase